MKRIYDAFHQPLLPARKNAPVLAPKTAPSAASAADVKAQPDAAAAVAVAAAAPAGAIAVAAAAAVGPAGSLAAAPSLPVGKQEAEVEDVPFTDNDISALMEQFGDDEDDVAD